MVLALHADFAFLERGTVRRKNQVNALVRFFFLLTFAAAIPAIISGGIAQRARFWPQRVDTAVIVGLIDPFFEGIAWNRHFGVQGWIKSLTGAAFHDFAGSVVVHAPTATAGTAASRAWTQGATSANRPLINLIAVHARPTGAAA